jgi:shikimate kinase
LFRLQPFDAEPFDAVILNAVKDPCISLYRYAVILKRYAVILKRYAVILKRYAVILKRYAVILNAVKDPCICICYRSKEPQMIADPAVIHPTDPAAAVAPAHLRRIVLTGFMGAGKTTVGRLLAARLGWDFLDLDAVIESRAGLAVPSIFAAHGEAHFRQLESQALAASLGRGNVVLALGGGAPESLTNRLLIEQTPATATIFLDAPFATLFDRCMMQELNPGTPISPGQARPILADPVAAEARFLARQPVYRRLAHLTVATASLTTEETVAALLARLNGLPARRL